MPQPDTERIAVIVGVGEAVDHPESAQQGLSPLQLMAAAARAAEADAGARLLGRLDSLDVVCQLSWPHKDTPGLLAEMLGSSPAHKHYGPIGGESPLRFIHEAGIRIAEGRSQVALVVGAEAEYTVRMARKEGITLDWGNRDETPIERGTDFMHPEAVKYGLAIPAHVYPLFENAAVAHEGKSPAQAHRESGELWEQFSKVAVQNPSAWRPQDLNADQIAAPSSSNRMISYPYPKSMVANPVVNQGAAVIVTSLAVARQAGIADHKLVYVKCGAAADDPRDYLERNELYRSVAMDVVLGQVLSEVGGDASVFTDAELYSCFPIVPKCALASLGTKSLAPTVTGGLSFFGAPFNNYMTHAAVAMVHRLRKTPSGLGLLYGNGGFMAYHHALVLASDPGQAQVLRADYRVQELADGRREETPPLVRSYQGPANLETFTVMFGRDGNPTHGVVIARTPENQRVISRVPGDDGPSIERLLDPDISPVGAAGYVSAEQPDLMSWQFAAATQ